MINENALGIFERDAVEPVGIVRAFQVLPLVFAKGIFVAQPEADFANDHIVSS